MKKNQRVDQIKVKTLYRAIPLTNIDNEKRTAEISFSSETPVDRWFGAEILDHDIKSVNLEWLNSGNAPLLIDHNNSVRDQIGIIEKAEIGADRKGRAVVRFGKSALAEELFNNVKDGITPSVSVGYRIHSMVLESSEDDHETYRINDWEPLEVSIVSVPADKDVGFGRGAESDGETWDVRVTKNLQNSNLIQESNDMKTRNQIARAPENEAGAAPAAATPAAATPAPAAVRADAGEIAQKAVKKRDKEIARILEIGKHFNAADEASKFIAEGRSADDFLDSVMSQKNSGFEKIASGSVELGLSKKEAQEFSYCRALLAKMDNDWTGAEFEREVCEQTAKLHKNKVFEGFAVPMDVMASAGREVQGMEKRTLEVGSLSGGGYMVGTTHMSGSFIDLLREQLLISKLGITVLSGLVGDVVIPKSSGGANAYWVGEEEDVTEGTPTFGNVKLSPKTVGAYVPITRKLLKQSSPSVELFVRQLLAKELAQAIETAIYNGSGASGEPLGIINTVGVGSVSLGTPATFANYVDMETEVAVDNALSGSLSYILTRTLVGSAKQTLQDSGVPGYIMANGEINGYAAHGTTLMPAGKSIFGNFNDAVLGEWGVLDLNVDTSNRNKSGGLELVALQDIDFAVRNAQSFCIGS